MSSELERFADHVVANYSGLLDESARRGPGLARMRETLVGLFNVNPALAQAARNEPSALCDAVLSALNLGLDFRPALGHAYLVPRKGKVSFQLGYRGLMELARRSGKVKSMVAALVYPGERFEEVGGTSRSLTHIPTPFAEGRVYANALGGYATAVMDDGTVDFEVMSKADIERARAVSASASGPWKDWPEEMARKTILRRLIKRLPLTPEAAVLIERDYRDDDARTVEVVQPAPGGPRIIGAPVGQRQESAPPDDAEFEEGPDYTRLDALAKGAGLPCAVAAVYICAREDGVGASETAAAAWCNTQPDSKWGAYMRNAPSVLADRDREASALRESEEGDLAFWSELGPKRTEAMRAACKRLGCSPADVEGDAVLSRGVALVLLGVKEGA